MRTIYAHSAEARPTYTERIRIYIIYIFRTLISYPQLLSTPFDYFCIHSLAFKGFIAVQWNKLPGRGLLSERAFWKRLRTIDDIIDIKVLERTSELENSRKQLETFGYSISHDLKAPLRIISGYCTILQNSPEVLTTDGMEMVQIISERAVSMGRLIDDLMKFSQTGCVQITKSRLSMYSMAKGVVRDVERQSKVPVRIDLRSMPEAFCDANLIRQVWVNLLSNAVKYSSKGEAPAVEIGAACLESGTVYYVKDNGVGFDMQQSHRLFRAFHRLHAESEYEGTGIGLALVHNIILRHGGKIWAQSESGRGATFFFTL